MIESRPSQTPEISEEVCYPDYCVCMLVHSVMFDSATPWAVACYAPLSMEFFRQGYWRGLLFPPSRDLPNPETEPEYLASPSLAVDSLFLAPLRKP